MSLLWTRQEKGDRLSLNFRTEAPVSQPGRGARSKTQVAGPSLRPLLWPIALFCIGGLLYFAKDVLVPLFVGFLVAEALAPAVSWLERRRIPTAVASVLVVLLLACALVVTAATLSRQVLAFQEHIPDLTTALSKWTASASNSLSRFLGGSRPTPMKVADVAQAVGTMTLSAIGVTFVSFAATAMTMIYTFFLLCYRKALLRRVEMLAKVYEWRRFSLTTERLSTVGPRYLFGLGLVVLLVAGLDSMGMALIKAPFPVMFGMMGGLAVLIPYVGILIIAPLCAGLTYLTTGDATTAGLVFLVYGVVHFTEGNVISPYLVGHQVDLNPIASLLAILAGGQLWGVPGMFLAVPAVGILKIVLESTPQTTVLARFLGRLPSAARPSEIAEPS